MYPNEPPEAQSIKSMLHIVRILAIIFGVLLLLGGLAYAALVAYYFSICNSVGIDAYCGASLGFLLIWPIIIIVFGVVDFLIFVQMKSIETLVNNRQYEQAKSKTLMWMVLGFILGGLLLGILLLIAYIKFDPLINASRQQGQMGGGYPPQGYAQPGYPPQGGAPPAYPPPAAAPMQQPPMQQAPPPAAAPAPGAAPFCSKCGKPTTYVAQYGRYYCYDDKLYV